MYDVDAFRVKINKNIYLLETTYERVHENTSEEDVYGLDDNDGIKKKTDIFYAYELFNAINSVNSKTTKN